MNSALNQYTRLFICSILFLSLSQLSEAKSFESSKHRTHLIELYTSEGCSSCPPADKWFSSLKSHSNLWEYFVPIAFHVTYWDYIGWKDPLGSEVFTHRQRAYSHSWNQYSVYTPGLVFNGKEWRGWSRARNIPQSDMIVGTLRVDYKENTYNASFSPSNEFGSKAELVLYIAALGFNMQSKVTAGENDGKSLKHDFAVLGIKSQKMHQSGTLFTTSIKLTPSELIREDQDGFAAWIQESGKMIPLQAVGGYV